MIQTYQFIQSNKKLINFIRGIDINRNDCSEYLNNKTFNPFNIADHRYNSSNDVDSFLVQIRNLNTLCCEYIFLDSVPSL